MISKKRTSGLSTIRQPFFTVSHSLRVRLAVEGLLQKALLGAQRSALCLKAIDVLRDHGLKLGRLRVFQIAVDIRQRAARALQCCHQHEVSQLQRRVVGVAAIGDECRLDQPDGAVMPQRLLRGAAQRGELSAAKIARFRDIEARFLAAHDGSLTAGLPHSLAWP